MQTMPDARASRVLELHRQLFGFRLRFESLRLGQKLSGSSEITSSFLFRSWIAAKAHQVTDSLRILLGGQFFDER